MHKNPSHLGCDAMLISMQLSYAHLPLIRGDLNLHEHCCEILGPYSVPCYFSLATWSTSLKGQGGKEKLVK